MIRLVSPFVTIGGDLYVMIGWDSFTPLRRGAPLMFRVLTPTERALCEQLLANALEEAYARTEGYAADRREEE